MAGTIRARFANGVLEPLEHLDVPEGEVLTITIIRLPAKEHRRQEKDEAVSDALGHLLPPCGEGHNPLASQVLTAYPGAYAVKAGGGGLERSAGGWKGLIDAEELKRNIYADRMISTRPEPRL